MICGIDVYHAAAGEKSKGSVTAFVASLDRPLTTWFSRVCLQRSGQELIDQIRLCLVTSIKAYAKHNGCPPQRIIIYRDGVGDGQIDTVAKHEIKQLEQAFNMIDSSYKPKLTVLIVQKRINTRLIANLVSYYDFFLFSISLEYFTYTVVVERTDKTVDANQSAPHHNA